MNLFFRNDRVRDFINDAVYFRHRRWQLLTRLEKLCGLWPYQSKLQQCILKTFNYSILLTFFLVVANKLRDNLDSDKTLECYLFMALSCGLMIKFMFFTISQRIRKQIYDRIAEHFEMMNDPDEALVLNECADQAFKYTAIYLSICAISVCSFDGIPPLRTIYNHFIFRDELKFEFPVPMDYGFRHEKYWYIIAVHYVIIISCGIIVNFAFDLSFILQIRHVKGLFKIVGLRLEKASKLVDQFEEHAMSNDATEESYKIMSSAVNLHSECCKIVQLIEKAYTINWFVILSLSTGGFGAGLHVVSTKLHDPIDLLRYLCLYLVVIIHFQVVFSQCQLIVDSSTAISNACYDCKWYRLPKKSCKLLSIMMMRSSIPCQLTGAKLFPLNIVTFSKMLKAGLSYYTLFET